MISLNYHHLYYFWTTAKAGSVTRASEQLLLAQPTMSLQIRQLEEAFGKKLLERHRDGVRLTEDGKVAFEYCERIFTQGEALLSAIKRGGKAGPTPLRIAVSSSLSREIVTKALASVSEYRPGAPITVFSGGAADIQDRLARHLADVALCDADLSTALGADYIGKLTASIPVVFVASPLLKRTLDAFPKCASPIPLLLRLEDNPLRKAVEEYLARHKAKFHVVAESDDSDLLRILAVEGRGVAAVSALNAHDDVKAGRLKLVGSRPTGISRLVWVVASRHPHPDDGVRGVIERLYDDFSIKS